MNKEQLREVKGFVEVVSEQSGAGQGMRSLGTPLFKGNVFL